MAGHVMTFFYVFMSVETVILVGAIILYIKWS